MLALRDNPCFRAAGPSFTVEPSLKQIDLHNGQVIKTCRRGGPQMKCCCLLEVCSAPVGPLTSVRSVERGTKRVLRCSRAEREARAKSSDMFRAKDGMAGHGTV